MRKSREIVFNQLYQNPIVPILGYKLRLHIQSCQSDSTYQAKFDNNPGKYERKSNWYLQNK
jgi:hypothetical protein